MSPEVTPPKYTPPLQRCILSCYDPDQWTFEPSFTEIPTICMEISVSTGPGPCLGPLWSNITLVQHRFGSCVAFALLSLFISYKSHFTQATKRKQLIPLAWREYLTSSNGNYICDIFNVKKLANSNLLQTYIESLIRFGSTRTKLLTFLNNFWSICGWTILSLMEIAHDAWQVLTDRWTMAKRTSYG